MVQMESILRVVDNSGAKFVKCIRVLGHKYGRPGHRIVVSVKEVFPGRKMKKGDIYNALIVQTRKDVKRKTGFHLKGGINACVLMKRTENSPVGNRIFVPIFKEVKYAGFLKVASIAPEIF